MNKIELIYDKFGLRINKNRYSLTQFFVIDGFKEKILDFLYSNTNFYPSSISISGSIKIGARDLDTTILQSIECFEILEKLFLAKWKNSGLKIFLGEKLGLIINKKRYYISSLVEFSNFFRYTFFKMIRNAIASIKNGSVVLKIGIELHCTHLSLFEYISSKLCYKSLAYCCGLENHCLKRDAVIKALRLTMDKYLELKLGFHNEIKAYFEHKGRYNLKGNSLPDPKTHIEVTQEIQEKNKMDFETFFTTINKLTCYKSLAYCCGLTKACPLRNSALITLGINLHEYTYLKQEFAKKILRVSKKNGLGD